MEAMGLEPTNLLTARCARVVGSRRLYTDSSSSGWISETRSRDRVGAIRRASEGVLVTNVVTRSCLSGVHGDERHHRTLVLTGQDVCVVIQRDLHGCVS